MEFMLQKYKKGELYAKDKGIKYVRINYRGKGQEIEQLLMRSAVAE